MINQNYKTLSRKGLLSERMNINRRRSAIKNKFLSVRQMLSSMITSDVLAMLADKALRYELWLKKNKRSHGRNISLAEAIAVFNVKNDLYAFALMYSYTAWAKKTLADIRRFNGNDLKIEEAKAIPISQLIQNFGYTQKFGKISCPFHKDMNASLKIYDNTNSWFCFGCNTGGSTIDFVMHHCNYSFAQAVRFLIQ